MLREQFKGNCPHRGVGILTCRIKPLEGEYKLVAIERFNHEDQRSDARIGFDNIHVYVQYYCSGRNFLTIYQPLIENKKKAQVKC